MTHKYIFISTLANTQNRQTRSRSHALAPLNVHTSQDYIKQPDKPHQQAQNASHLYMGKMHKPHNEPKLYSRVICTYAAILKNCIMRPVFQLCLYFVTTLKMFCNLFVIYGQNRRAYVWEN